MYITKEFFAVFARLFILIVSFLLNFSQLEATQLSTSSTSPSLTRNLKNERRAHIRQASEDMFQTHLIRAEKARWEKKNESSRNDSDQLEIWNKLDQQISEATFKDYTVEVHYIDIDNPDFKNVHIYKNSPPPYTFLHSDNHKVIPVVLFKPNSASAKEPVPVGIFNHGGSANNYFYPFKRNPIITALARLGYAALCFNWGTTTDPYEKELEHVIKYLRSQDYIKSNKIVLTGISAGTTLNANILNSPVVQNLAGIFLHTGLYNKDSVFKGLDRISTSSLPIFLASGGQDESVPIRATQNYISALKGIFKDFSYFILPQGGHQLIKVMDTDIPTINDKMTVTEVVNRIKGYYNTDEMKDYVQQLVSFFDKIKYGENLYPFQNTLKEEQNFAETVTKHGIVMGEHSQRLPGLRPVETTVKNMPSGRVREDINQEDKRDKNKAKPYGSDDDLPLQVLKEKSKYTPSKATNNKAPKPNSPELAAIKEQIRTAPYTTSEGFQRFILERKHEGNKDYVYKPGKDNLSDNMVDLLKDSSIAKDFEEARKAGDIFLKILEDAVNEEKNHKDKFVFYHGADPALSFIYDIFSEFRRQLILSGSSNTKALRGLDTAFANILNVDEFINKFKDKEGNIDNYRKDPNVGDYQDMGLSVNFALFGNYLAKGSSTLHYFFNSYSQKPPKPEKLFNTFAQSIGLKSTWKDYEPIYQEYYQNKDQNITVNPLLNNLEDRQNIKSAQLNGRLLQIFIDPSVVDEMVYLSVLKGNMAYYTVDGKKYGGTLKILPLLMAADQTPLKDVLRTGRSGTEEADDLATLQARLFLKPEYMLAPNLVSIKEYWRHPLKPEYKQSYEAKLRAIVRQDLANWLVESKGASQGMFAKGTNKLQQLYQYVYKGTIGQEYAPTINISNLPSLIKKGNKADVMATIEKFPDSLNKPLIDSTDYRQKEELTPLQIAIKYRQGDIIKWLLSELGKISIPIGSDQLTQVLPSFMDDTSMIESLIKKGATLNFSLLIEAIKQGKIDTVTLIHNKQAELFAQKEQGTHMTPLHQAAISGQIKIVQFILQHYPNQLRDTEDETSYTPLHEAIAHNHKAIIEFFLNQYVVDELMKISPSILDTAINNGNGQIAALILEKIPGLKENFYKNLPRTMYDTVQFDDNAKRINAIFDTGNEALQILLSQQGFDSPKNLFREAIVRNKVDIAKTLLAKIPDLRNGLFELYGDGKSRLNGVIENIGRNNNKTEMLEFLLTQDDEKHTLLTMKDRQNNTPLDAALSSNSIPIIEVLLAKKSDLWRFLGTEKENIFQWPVYHNNLNLIQLLIKKAPKDLLEATFASTSIAEGGLLHLAVAEKKIEPIQILLRLDDHFLKLLMHKNEKGETPFEIAKTAGDKQILELFAQRGFR